MNQVFICISLPKNNGSRKIYEYKFLGKQARLVKASRAWQCTTRNSFNTNRLTDKIILSVNCDDNYRRTLFRL